MDLRAYLKTLSKQEIERLAERCETTVGQIRQVSKGRRAGEKLAINIDRETEGVISAEQLRPDVDFGYLRKTGYRA